MDSQICFSIVSAGELADAIHSANDSENATAIQLRADITISEDLPVIAGDLTIAGNGYTIDGNGISTTFEVGEGGSLNLIYVKFINCKQDTITAISSVGELHLTNCAIDCHSVGSKGSITIYNSFKYPAPIIRGDLSLSNCTFLGDPKRNLGVFIENLGKLSLAYCTFDKSSSGSSCVIFSMHDLTATHCAFANNTGAGAGVAICNESSVTLNDCVFVNNAATEWGGGALFNDKGDMSLNRCSLLDNSAARGGGAIVNHKGELKLENCSLMGNSAKRSGGAIASFRGANIITNCTISENRAEEEGGGLSAFGGDVRLTHVTMVNNSAESGGGVHAMDEGYSRGIGLRNSILAGNQGGDYVGCLDYSVGNLIGDGSCDHAISGDPMLGDLVEPDDGSPAYYPPLPGSPTIDAAHNHFCADSDQLGTRRPHKSFAGDIGAIEYVFDD